MFDSIQKYKTPSLINLDLDSNYLNDGWISLCQILHEPNPNVLICGSSNTSFLLEFRHRSLSTYVFTYANKNAFQ